MNLFPTEKEQLEADARRKAAKEEPREPLFYELWARELDLELGEFGEHR